MAQATQRAVQTLVIRLTGDAKAADGPGLAAVRKDPQQIISQYGYDAGPPESLQVDFDPVSTDRVLREAGLSTPLIIGGIIPETDAQAMLAMGVAAIYTPKDFDLNRIMFDIVGLADAKAQAA